MSEYEDVPRAKYLEHRDMVLASIAISLKRIADALTAKSQSAVEKFEEIHGYKP